MVLYYDCCLRVFSGCRAALVLTCLLVLCLHPVLAANGVLFQDDFTTAVPNRWTIVDEGKKHAPSAWAVHRGAFKQTSLVYTEDTTAYPGTYALAGDAGWGDYTLSLLLRSEGKNALGVLFRYSDAKNYYRFRWSRAKNLWNGRVLERVVDGKWTVLASDTVGYADIAYHNLKIQLVGDRIILYLDDMTTPVFDVRDAGTPLKAGKIGLYSWANTKSIFDNVAVYTNDAKSPFTMRLSNLTTITGRAFVDSNRNGVPDTGEAGLPGLVVSDGAKLTVTDARGNYTLAGNDPFSDRFVFVVSPSGYRCLNGYYRPIPDDKETVTADFALVAAPETASPDLTFVQITDTHVTRESQSLLNDLKEIAKLAPAFVMVTGDLVEGGGRNYYENYYDAVRQSPVPVVSGIGNHDTWTNGLDLYEEFFGPAYFAFDYAGRHFVYLGNVSNKQMTWMQAELALQPKEKEVLVFQHSPPNEVLLKLLEKYNVVANFSGHTHTGRISSSGERPITFVNSQPVRFGGIDASVRGFRLAKFSNGKLTMETRVSGVNQHCTLVAPADGATVPQGPFVVDVSAYDTGLRVTGVQYQLDNGPWKAMRGSGDFHWSAQETSVLGMHTLRVRATFTGGGIVERQSRFTVANQQAPVPQPGKDWPMLQHDPTHCGSIPDTVKPPLVPVWRTNLGSTTHMSSPVVVGDMLYIGVADEDNIGKAGVYALQIRTGEVRWYFRTASSVKQTVSVANGLVYANTVGGTLHAIDVESGKERWQYAIGDAPTRWISPAPLVIGTDVYFCYRTIFIILDALTGQKRKEYRKIGPWLAGIAPPAADDGKLLIGWHYSRGFTALDRQTGAKLWSQSKGESHATPVLSNGGLFFPAGYRLYAMDAGTGKDRWEFKLPGKWPVSSAAIAGNKVLIGGGDGQLYCLDVTTGKERWHFQTGAALLDCIPYMRGGSNIVGSPAIAGNVVYLGGTDGKFYALDLETGKKLWEYQLGTAITASPAISGNTVYISTYDGTVYAFTQTP